MVSPLFDVQLWLDHANEVRALSRAVADRRTKQQMLAVAAGFDRIANLASTLQSNSRTARAANTHFTGRVRSMA